MQITNPFPKVQMFPCSILERNKHFKDLAISIV